MGCLYLFIWVGFCSVIYFFSPLLGVIVFIAGITWYFVGQAQDKRLNAERDLRNKQEQAEYERQINEAYFRQDLLSIERQRLALEQERSAREQQQRTYSPPPEPLQTVSVARQESPTRQKPKASFPQVPPDAPCPCGSGKPYKACHRNR
jgi:uncharacterized protein YecA (UPF0149 family)